MTVTVFFTDGKKKTFRGVHDVRNQELDYRLPRNDARAATVLIPKASVKYMEIEGS